MILPSRAETDTEESQPMGTRKLSITFLLTLLTASCGPVDETVIKRSSLGDPGQHDGVVSDSEGFNVSYVTSSKYTYKMHQEYELAVSESSLIPGDFTAGTGGITVSGTYSDGDMVQITSTGSIPSELDYGRTYFVDATTLAPQILLCTDSTLGGTCITSYTAASISGTLSILNQTSTYSNSCSIAQGTTGKDLYCILEAKEEDLWAFGATLNVNIPTDMCDFLFELPYYYYTMEPHKTNGKQSIKITSDTVTNSGTTQYYYFDSDPTITPKSFLAQGGVTAATDTITVASHGFVTGQQVGFRCGTDLKVAGVNCPGGIGHGSAYYAIRVDSNNFKIATTFKNAMAGTVVDLTAGAGNTAIYVTAISTDPFVNVTVKDSTPTVNCQANYTTTSEDYPNCCEGSYEIFVTDVGPTSPTSGAGAETKFTGKRSACLTGPATEDTSLIDKNGYPKTKIHTTTGTGINTSRTFTDPGDVDLFGGQHKSNIYLANYMNLWDPDTTNRHDYIGPDLPAAISPSSSRYSPATSRYYDYGCYNRHRELLNRIRVQVRSWDYSSNFNTMLSTLSTTVLSNLSSTVCPISGVNGLLGCASDYYDAEGQIGNNLPIQDHYDWRTFYLINQIDKTYTGVTGQSGIFPGIYSVSSY